MRIPTITGTIKRRFLINYRIDPDVLARILPPPFKPKLHNGYAIGGVCLIRLEKIRPEILPLPCGMSSENAAHRFAVTWDDKEGVYIPRRDSDSLMNQVAGGRLFPGVHHAASFEINESDADFDFSMKSDDEKVHVAFSGSQSETFPEESCFSSLEESSKFFEAGSLGYSDTKGGKIYDGLSLVTNEWAVSSFDMKEVFSSYFADKSIFPEGSVEYDHALFMLDIRHKWRQEDDLCC